MVNKAEKFTDTIAALITPPGQGAVSIIRMSGPSSINTLEKIFSGAKNQKLKDRTLYYGTIKDGTIRDPKKNSDQSIEPSGLSIIDDSMAVVMKGPASYTGEDVVEIFCHGSTLITKKILSLLFSLGLRPADPGEFTKRAFLNGTMDLDRAESVADIINAETDLALSSAKAQRRGGLSKKVTSIKEDIANILTLIEAELDFSEEEEVERGSADEITAAIEKPESEIKKLLSTYNEGRIIKDGLRVLILGKPNSGKSSLLNILLKEERAIVTSRPGTTRDVIEDVINIGGLPIRLMDTAGLRETSDEVEAIGVKAAKDRIGEAGLILYVIDLSQDKKDFEEDLENLKDIYATHSGKKIIVVMNKSDVTDLGDTLRDKFKDYNISTISALKEEGIQALEKKMVDEVLTKEVISSASGGEVITNLRHKDCLERAGSFLLAGRESLGRSDGREFTAAELRGALDALGQITGEVTTDDILNRIFSTFCIGK